MNSKSVGDLLPERGMKMFKLDIYKVIEGTDDWLFVETIEAKTEKECFELAEEQYGQDDYHWTNPSAGKVKTRIKKRVGKT